MTVVALLVAGGHRESWRALTQWNNSWLFTCHSNNTMFNKCNQLIELYIDSGEAVHYSFRGDSFCTSMNSNCSEAPVDCWYIKLLNECILLRDIFAVSCLCLNYVRPILASNVYGVYISAIDLHNSPMAIHGNSCLISMYCYISAHSFEIHSNAWGLCSILQR